MISQKNKQAWRNPWVLLLLALVSSGVLINARMLWNMMHHPMRLLDEHYTVKDHNRYDAKWLQQQAERSTLGWQAKLHSPQRLKNDSLASADSVRFILTESPAELQLELKDRDGKEITGAQVVVEAQSPGDPTSDFKTAMNATSSGHYQGSLKFPRAGNWDLLIRAEVDDRQFDMEQRVFASISKQP
jgi:cell division protein FtsL